MNNILEKKTDKKTATTLISGQKNLLRFSRLFGTHLQVPTAKSGIGFNQSNFQSQAEQC